MVLSIGMIVKNEEKYLEKCLTALKPILENVDSELIIADTGSTDNTVEIAKRFTDNVFHFEWINDFAAARNSTLDKAKGEWYMFIDADEIIKDCTPLIEFFNSGEYKSYGSATINVRNYNDLAHMDLYDSCDLRRMTALINGVRFTKPVHECFNPLFNPVKNLNLIVDHYGYVFKDNGKTLDIAKEKSKRNLDLLFKEIERAETNGENPNQIVYGQIADCYILVNELDKALDYVELGLENCPLKSYTRLSYINKKIIILDRMGKSPDIIEACKYYFSKENLARTKKLATDCSIYFFWVLASFQLKEYDEVINKSVLGFEVYRSYLSGKLRTEELNYCGFETTIPMLKKICNLFLITCIKKKKYDIAAREIDLIPLKEIMYDREFMQVHIAVRAQLMEYTNYNKLPDLYYQMDDPNKKIFVTTFIRNIFKTKKHEHFLKKLSLIKDGNERLTDIIDIYEDFFLRQIFDRHKVEDFIQKHGSAENETVLVLMLMRNTDIAPFVCAEDFNAGECCKALLEDFTYPNEAIEPFENYPIAVVAENALGKAAELFYEMLCETAVKKVNISKLISQLSKLGERFTELFPDADAPKSVQFALRVSDVVRLDRNKEYDKCLEQLSELIGKDEQAAEKIQNIYNKIILLLYRELIRQAKEKQAEMLAKQTSSTAALTDQIKLTIRGLIDEWDLDSAEETLNQMEKINPFDPDIEKLRDEINDRKINYMNYM